MSNHEDLFEDVLNLEDQYYREGYDLGVADGSKSGRIEGRIFGLEKGFEKFVEMGKLHGKAAIWEARLDKDHATDDSDIKDGCSSLPSLGESERLRKHVQRLAALTDPDDLSTNNTEDSVSEFDDRLKDAKAKATLISRIVGEDDHASNDRGSHEVHETTGDQKAPLRVRRHELGSTAKRTGEMEDFVGLPGAGR